MEARAKLGAFAAAVALMFGGAYGVGQAVGPSMPVDGMGHAAPADSPRPAPKNAKLPAGGLMVAQDGYRLELASDNAVAGQPGEIAFRVLGPDGAPFTDFTDSHDKPMHLIVVRRDMSGFQHVHPTLGADGTWRIPMTFDSAGDYRIFADFDPGGPAEGMTLGADLAVSGAYAPVPLPAASREAIVDGYTVRLDGDLAPGRTSPLTLNVSKDGKPVTDLQPYLAAYGHLVALRDGDLAYLHVHPEGAPGDGKTAAGPQITFYAEVPSAGDYRLFLDFRHQEVVRTAEFTASAQAAAPASPSRPQQPGPAPDAENPNHGGH